MKFVVGLSLVCLLSGNLCGCATDPKNQEIKALEKDIKQAKDAAAKGAELDIRRLEARLSYLKGKTPELDHCQYNLRLLGTAAELASISRKSRYPDTLDALKPGIFRELPVCPLGGAYTFTSTGAKGPPDGYVVTCKAHKIDYKTGPI